jgi:type IV pilus assembly protein PilV
MLTRRLQRSAQRGASLLEVMVAILILSIGMLAMAGLHAVSIQQGKMAQFRGTAMQLGADFADRMRANRGAFGFVAPFPASPYVYMVPYTSNPPPVAVPACAVATACTAAERAAVDLAEWRNIARNALPGGNLYVTQEAGTNIMNVWVLWIDPDAKDTAGGGGSMSSAQHCPAGVGGDIPPQCLALRVVI